MSKTSPLITDGLRLSEVFVRTKEASRNDLSPSLSIRRDRLSKLEALLQENQPALCRAISEDFGHRSPHETRLLEIFPSLGFTLQKRALSNAKLIFIFGICHVLVAFIHNTCWVQSFSLRVFYPSMNVFLPIFYQHRLSVLNWKL